MRYRGHSGHRALGSTEIASAGVAGAAGALGAGSDDSSNSDPAFDLNKPRPPALPEVSKFSDSMMAKTPNASLTENPLLSPAYYEIFKEQQDYFKENIQGLVELATPEAMEPKNSPTFIDTVRSFGSYLTHEVIDAVDETFRLPVAVLDFAQRGLGDYLPDPDGLLVSPGSVSENYENYIAKIHQAVDQLFSTDWADRYTPKAKADDPFTYGVLPPPNEVLPGTGKATGLNIPKKGNVTVYHFVNEMTGEVKYVGITNNFERRSLEHLREKGIKVTPIKGLQDLTRANARAVEQTLIELHQLEKSGGTLINKINSIAETNPKYAEALQRGAQILKETGNLD